MKGNNIIRSVFPLITVILCCTIAVMALLHYADSIPAFSLTSNRLTLVIDAGHGGIDGGAVSTDGTRESDINLAIALRLDSIVRFCGQQTVMTRWDDSSKSDMLSYSEREDLKYRADLANRTEQAVLISIHQNDFPTAQPRGSQVLYSAFGSSNILGRQLQENLVSQLDPENRRLAAPAPRELYLTAHVRCPAVLVECGFMSNNFEVMKLKDPVYQTQLATVIAATYLSYIGETTQSEYGVI